MPVSDLQVAALRSLLLRETDEHKRMMDELGDQGIRYGYLELLTMTFMRAAQKRFDGKNSNDVIDWISQIRSERDPQGNIDPNVAENLILWSFGKGSVDTMSMDMLEQQSVLLLVIIEDLGFDEEKLNAFLQRAREEAEEVQQNLEQS